MGSFKPSPTTTSEPRIECVSCGFRFGWIPEKGQWLCVQCNAPLPRDETYSLVGLEIGWRVLLREHEETKRENELLKHQVENWKRRAKACEQSEGPG